MVFVLSILYHIPLPVSCIKCEETPYFRAFAGFSSMSLRMSFLSFYPGVGRSDEHTSCPGGVWSVKIPPDSVMAHPQENKG